jgi:hypothetical protein
VVPSRVGWSELTCKPRHRGRPAPRAGGAGRAGPGPHSPRPYDAKESVGIAVGLLLAALHQAGLATLTHTPSPMRWLNEILDRPVEERAFVVVPVGYAAEGATVPDIDRKGLDEVLVLSDGTAGAALNISRPSR